MEFTGVEDLNVRLGRQLVALDNRRWVSENDFRQIPQLFDGASVTYTGLGNTELVAGHYRRIRSTSGTILRLQHARYDPGKGRPDPEIRKTWLTLTYTY